MSTIYSNNFNEIYYKIASTLLNDPDYKVKNRGDEDLSELVDFSFELMEPSNCFATIRDMSLDYLAGELEFYLSGSPFLKDISKHSKFWEKVTDDNKTINSNYGKLLLYDRNVHNNTQFEYARDCLLNNRESKKAVMVIYSPENAFKSNDNPCTMYLQYMIRKNPRTNNDELHLFVKMRSSDIWFGLPYDVPFFVLMQYKMIHELRSVREDYKAIEIGSYIHQSGSLHLYKRNEDKLFKMLSPEGVSADELQDKLEEDQSNLFDIFIKSRILNWKDVDNVQPELPESQTTEDMV